MKPAVFSFILLAISCHLCSEPTEKNGTSVFAQAPRFEEYPVSIHKGKIVVPSKFRKDRQGTWRDEFGKSRKSRKLILPESILSLHSCGAECRYYQLTDLTSGRSVSSLDMFASAEPPNVTRDGYRYMTILYYRADSRMLVARYQIDTGIVGEYDCRERVFLFDEAEQIKPITRTKYRCGE
ncbi:MAG: hypothetical protein LBO00_02855 [Zoogloeaceae bacterium]|nr:hypothetical protein [Zoogloeaceae bacterium]